VVGLVLGQLFYPGDTVDIQGLEKKAQAPAGGRCVNGVFLDDRKDN